MVRLFGPPQELLHPQLDKWLIGPLAMVTYVIQYPSYLLVEQTPWWASGPAAPMVILASVLSTLLYIP